MIKRIFIIFCVLILLVVTMALPAFATEVQDDSSIKIVKQPQDKIIDVNKDGNFNVTFRIVVSGDVKSYQWQFSKDGGLTWQSSVNATATTDVFNFLGNKDDYKDCFVRCIVTGNDGTVVISRLAYVEFVQARFLRFVSSSIDFAIDWVSSVVSSLVSPEGSLYPLLSVLAIGIAVTAVLLVIKIFKSFSWGL